jgi:hypothetical protein
MSIERAQTMKARCQLILTPKAAALNIQPGRVKWR